MIEEYKDPNSGAIIFRKDKESKALDDVLALTAELKKKCASLERRCSSLENKIKTLEKTSN